MNRKGFALIIILFAALGLLIADGVWYYVASKPQSPSPSAQNQNYQPTQQVTTTPTSSSSQGASADIIIETGYTADYDYTTGPNGNVVSQRLVFVSPTKQRIVVPLDTASKIDLPTRFQLSHQKGGE